MSNIDKQALRKRYSAKPTPKCDICGARMTIQRMSGSRVTYGCSGAIYDETGCHYAEGRSLADDHYEQSRVTVTDESDPDVLALLDELEAEPVAVTEDMAYAFHHALSDSSLGADEVEEIKAGLRAAFANVTAPPAPVSVPAAMLQGADGALTNEDTKRVGELVMWVKRLAHLLRKANPDSKLQSDAMDYLSRKGLIGVEDILR